MNDLPWTSLLAAAETARGRAYAPYSKFHVGAAALWDDGTITPGCNVENASYGLCLCAERNAVGRGVADGKKKLKAMAVVVDAAQPVPPCGMCRQVMAEFGAADIPVRSKTVRGEQQEYRLGELLPHAFTRDFL